MSPSIPLGTGPLDLLGTGERGKRPTERFLRESNGGGHGSRTPSVAGSGLNPPSPAPTKGASPLVRTPRKGRTPFGTPGRGFSDSAEEVWWRAAVTTVVD